MDRVNNSNSKDVETVELKRIVISYLRRWRLIGGVCILSVILAICYLLIIPRTYEIMARVKIADNAGSGRSGYGLGEAAGMIESFGFGGGGAVSLDDEISILMSNSLLRKMILELGLNVNYMKPNVFNYRMYQESPLTLVADSATALALSEEISFDISLAKDGSAKLKVKKSDGKQAFEYPSLPATVILPEGNFTIRYANNKVVPLDMEMIMRPVSWVAEDLANEFVVEEVSKLSTVIELTCTDYDRRRGVDMLNTLIRLYNDESTSAKLEDAGKSLDFINDRLTEAVDALSKSEIQIEQYKLAHGMIDIEHDIQFNLNQIQKLQSKIIELEAQSHVISMMYSFINDPSNKYNLVPMLMSQEGRDNGNTPIAIYNDKLLERARLLQTSKSESPLITQINEQIDKLRESVFISISNTQKGIQQTISELKDKERIGMDKFETVPSVEREYIDYKRQQKIYQGVYLVLLQKQENLLQAIGDQKDKVRVLDAAFVKQKTVAPRKLYAAIGVMGATLFIPIFLMLFWNLYVSLKEEFIRSKKEDLD